jgi:putative polyhydroxyalkanoate system protein
MSNISIAREHKLGLAGAKQKIDSLVTTLGEKYGIKLVWRGNEADVKGSGVTGKLKIEETRIALDLKLGLMLTPLAGKIREGLERGVDKALA